MYGLAARYLEIGKELQAYIIGFVTFFKAGCTTIKI